MKLWLLKPVPGSFLDDYDWYSGFVVRADTEKRARELLRQRWSNCPITGNAWANSKKATCEGLLVTGSEGIVFPS
jgi:hypothetical protein